MSSASQSRFAAVERILLEAVEARAFPCAVAEIGASDGPRWATNAGRLHERMGAIRRALGEPARSIR